MIAHGFRRHHRREFGLLCAGAWVLAFILTHIPASGLPDVHVTDKTMHLVGYAGLTTLFWLTLWAYEHPPKRRIILCLTLLTAYGALDEATQPIFNRHASAMDWLYDIMGIVLAVSVWELLAWRIRARLARTDATAP